MKQNCMVVLYRLFETISTCEQIITIIMDYSVATEISKLLKEIYKSFVEFCCEASGKGFFKRSSR